MDVVRHKISLARLPFRAAAAFAVVCVAILGMSAAREWSAREAVLKVAEVEFANLARSLIQHADDSFDLLDTSIVGAVNRLEAEGTNPATVSKLQDILVARKATSARVSVLAIVDERGPDGGADDFFGGLMRSFHAEMPAEEARALAIDNAVTFYAAGHETTAVALTWVS